MHCHILQKDITDEYARELTKVVPVEKVEEGRKFACPLIGCASIVKDIRKHLSIHVQQKKITSEERILYLKRCQKIDFVLSDVSTLKCLSSLKVSEIDFARHPGTSTSTETIARGNLNVTVTEQRSPQSPEENDNWETDECTSESSSDPDYLPVDDLKKLKVTL